MLTRDFSVESFAIMLSDVCYIFGGADVIAQPWKIPAHFILLRPGNALARTERLGEALTSQVWEDGMTFYKEIRENEPMPFVVVRIFNDNGTHRAMLQMNGQRTDDTNPKFPAWGDVKEGLEIGYATAKEYEMPLRIRLDGTEWNPEWGKLDRA